MNNSAENFEIRYSRQIAFKPFGSEGQRRLAQSRVLIVGAGGLGSWAAEILTRCGVGFVRICDDDIVELSNLHRQSLYFLADVEHKNRKVNSAAKYLNAINPNCQIEPISVRADRFTLPEMAKDVDVVFDATDNFYARFLINDFAFKMSKPWIFAGVIEAQGQTAVFIPNKTPCLRCVMPSPPHCSGQDVASCRQSGVLGSAVAAISSFAAMEAIKLLSGQVDRVSPFLTFIDLWNNSFKQIPLLSFKTAGDCPCCDRKDFEFLEP